MVDINPEKLMSYVDEELDAKEQAEIEELMKRDPEVRSMVAQFRKSAEMLKGGFDDILDLPVPQQLIDSVKNHQARSNIVQIDKTQKDKGLFAWPGLALAATVALSVGLFAGAVLFGGLNVQSPTPRYSSLLQDSLEMKLSGVSAASEDGFVKVTPLMTFIGTDGLICREFERMNPEQKTVGIACRGDQGEWLVMAEIDRILLAGNTAEEFDYSPVSGPDDPINMVLSELGAITSLPAKDEELLRDKGWQ
ncbi:MAG TPA: hypothetical protein VKN62_00560 [Pelovirga sp.]|nr:hypothetical protein [Pelovirga sp.]